MNSFGLFSYSNDKYIDVIYERKFPVADVLKSEKTFLDKKKNFGITKCNSISC